MVENIGEEQRAWEGPTQALLCLEEQLQTDHYLVIGTQSNGAFRGRLRWMWVGKIKNKDERERKSKNEKARVKKHKKERETKADDEGEVEKVRLKYIIA